MKKLSTLIVAALLLLVTGLTGCKTTPASLESRITIIAQLGAGEALLANPAWKDGFNLAVADLKIIEAGDTVNIAQVVAIVQRLPVKELQSARGRLYVATGLLLIQEAGAPTELNPDTTAQVKAIARGLRVGIENALAYTQ